MNGRPPTRGGSPWRGVAVLVYDGDCGFCRRCVRFGRRLRWFPPAVAFQHADLAAIGLNVRQARRSVYLHGRDGYLYGGADAVIAVLRGQPGVGWRALGHVMRLPPLHWVAAGIYEVVSRNRHHLSAAIAWWDRQR